MYPDRSVNSLYARDQCVKNCAFQPCDLIFFCVVCRGSGPEEEGGRVQTALSMQLIDLYR